MNILGLITARGGSKSIPRKNIALLNGRPLIAYTCDAARASARISRLVLSTEDEEIAQVGRAYGAETPFVRPLELAQDTTPSLPVAQHAVNWLVEHENWQTDILVLLQPTSPLRQTRHIDEALAAMLAQNADTVVSVVEVPHRFSPYNVMRQENGRLENFIQDPLPFDRYRRQNLPRLYARNGPAILATRSQTLLAGNNFYGNLTIPYVMAERDSLDIDNPLDLELAAWFLQRGPEAI